MQILGSNLVPNLGSSHQPHNPTFGVLQELLISIQESTEATAASTWINEVNRGVRRHPAIPNSLQPTSQAVIIMARPRGTAEADTKEEHNITQQQDFNTLLGLEPANGLLPMERFCLCHPKDSATLYDIIQSRSMFGDVTAILTEIDALL